MPVHINLELLERKYFKCNCGVDGEEFRYDHLGPSPKKAGPWYCDTCGTGYDVLIEKDGSPTVTPAQPRNYFFKPELWLLKYDPGEDVVVPKPLYSVIRWNCIHNHNETEEERDEWRRYYVEESSCPTNFIPCEAWIEGENDDPHGVWAFVQAIPLPPNYGHPPVQNYEEWCSLFDKLPKPA